MKRLASSRRLPTVKLRHKISGKKLIVNATDYAAKIGVYAKNYKLDSYRVGDASDDVVERAIRETEIEWQKTRDGRDDRPQRRFEDRAGHQNIVVPQDDDATPAPAPITLDDATTSSNVVEPADISPPDGGTVVLKESFVPRRGRPRRD